MKAVAALDLIVLAVALVVFIAAGLPLVGYAVAAFAWLAQRAIGELIARKIAGSSDPKTVVGLTGGGAIGRGLLVFVTILVAGLLAGDDAGLAAAVLILILFTAYFTARLALRPFEKEAARP